MVEPRIRSNKLSNLKKRGLFFLERVQSWLQPDSSSTTHNDKKNNYGITLSTKDQQHLALPAIFFGLGLCIILLLFSLNPGLPLVQRQVNLGLGLGGVLYIVLAYFVILQNFETGNIFFFITTIICNTLITSTLVLLQTYLPDGFLPLTIIVLMVSSAVLLGRWTTYIFILLTYFIQAVFFISDLIPAQQNAALQIFATTFVSVLVTETVTMTKNAIALQYHRLETLNQVAHSLASSLDISQVISLVSDAIQTTLDADTYYLGLLENDSIHLEMLYDEGVFFPNTDIALENSLAGWVVTHKKPLLLRNVTDEARVKYGIKVSTIGQPKLSHSWMGVPLETGGRIFGIVAVASYKANKFDQSSLEMLQNFTQQAAMALDNATHHAEVEDQSRRDSLTGTLNHGTFLQVLEREVADARVSNQPVSLIMLDIDKFKEYNDHFGHLVGDQVLISICDTMRRYIKSTDAIGRWGGEEFVIVLPHATGHQAIRVANRIRRAIGEIILYSRDQKTIPAPTISQGIAIFPQDCPDSIALIDLADQRLYRAKERGRNQLEPETSIWPEL